MNWFEGEIAQAVATSKAKGAIFVVYVYGKDEKSSQILQCINTEEVGQILGSDSFVAIKIEADSVSHQQFSQIYKQVPVPSVYFIGKQGLPIEIVTEVQDGKSFKEKLNAILQKGGLPPIAAQTQSLISSEQESAASTSNSKPDNVVCENGVCYIKKDEKEESAKTPEKSEDVKAETEGSQELSVDEKVERAKQLVEKKREEKRREEAEKEKLQEIERRKTGQSVQQLKRWQDDEELKQVLEARKKEKRENQEAKERVLAQIAQDKAERAAKFSPSPAPTPAAAPQTPKPSSNTARLQFRMPDGRTATNDFASRDTLEEVHSYIRAHLQLPFSSYTLSTTFPRREFTDVDKGQSLMDLGLVPTAVILILPLNRGTVSTNTEGGFMGLVWTLLAPIVTILGYLKTFVFGSAPAGGASGSGQSKRAADGPSTDARNQPKVRRGGETTVIRKQGNVHRLSNKNDSDDENNTWNGNSTQQM